ncbi:MAG: hypothetical protein KUG69_11215 [Marinosulfonomonas sp.]|nr:hypothetical protein [Marinosulfonomonas sp.]
MKRFTYVILWIVVLICSLPLLGIVWSSWFAGKHGCTLNEANYHPCIVNGTDWGHSLGAAFISGWYGLITIPVGAATLLVIATMMVFGWIKKRRNRKAENA